MHSFQPSRGRVLFEFACALGVVASFVGAWKQTGASALLLAAVAVGLCGFVRLFDLAHGEPAEAAEPQRIDFATDEQDDVPNGLDVVVPMVVAEPLMVAVDSIEDVEAAESVAPHASESRRAKTPRKSGGGRKARASKDAKVVEIAPFEEEAEVTPASHIEDVEADLPEAFEEEHHAPLAPLFEPEPYARMQRPAFGRKAGFGRRAG